MRISVRFYQVRLKSKLLSCLILTTLLAIQCSPTRSTVSDSAESQAIRMAMQTQEDAWNRGDIPAFMEGYWQDKGLTFIGSKGITSGWDQTLANYLKGYPDKEAMGTLTFEVIELRRLGPKAFYMIGKYTLKRVSDQPSGYFNLIWEKVEDNWVITSDHTSG